MVVYKKHDWVEEFPGEITVCDSAGIVLELNKVSVEVFRKEGGKKLIGSNLLDCHPPAALRVLKRLMRCHKLNVYTVTKGRHRNLVIQTPWYKRGKYRGFVELNVPITGRIPNIVRK